MAKVKYKSESIVNGDIAVITKKINNGSSLQSLISKGYKPANIKAACKKKETQIIKKELATFRNHLATLYNNTLKEKKENEIFSSSRNILNDILELAKKLSPNGTLDYNLKDRIIRMFLWIYWYKYA